MKKQIKVTLRRLATNEGFKVESITNAINVSVDSQHIARIGSLITEPDANKLCQAKEFEVIVRDVK